LMSAVYRLFWSMLIGGGPANVLAAGLPGAAPAAAGEAAAAGLLSAGFASDGFASDGFASDGFAPVACSFAVFGVPEPLTWLHAEASPSDAAAAPSAGSIASIRRRPGCRGIGVGIGIPELPLIACDLLTESV
jgi:hypothetical protein